MLPEQLVQIRRNNDFNQYLVWFKCSGENPNILNFWEGGEEDMQGEI